MPQEKNNYNLKQCIKSKFLAALGYDCSHSHWSLWWPGNVTLYLKEDWSQGETVRVILLMTYLVQYRPSNIYYTQNWIELPGKASSGLIGVIMFNLWEFECTSFHQSTRKEVTKVTKEPVPNNQVITFTGRVPS